MKKIEALTAKQEEMLPVWRDKWLRIGLSTERFTREEAQGVVDAFYIKLLKRPAVPVFVFDCPLTAWAAVVALKPNSVVVDFRSQLDYQLRSQFGSRLRSQLGSQLETQLGSQLRSRLRSQLRSQLETQLGGSNIIWPCIWGSFDSYYFCFYSYILEVLNLKFDEMDLFSVYTDTTKLGCIWHLDDFCIICQKPLSIDFNRNKLLHNAHGPVVEYAGGLSRIWCLNGVGVPREVVETDDKQIPVEWYFSQQNLEVRREIGRKIGVNRIVSKVDAKLLDKDDDYGINEIYRLYRCQIDGEPYLFLRMKNPSLPVDQDKHDYVEVCEWLPPDSGIETVQQALNFRNGLKPEEIHENGTTWFQQGDVILRPKNHKVFKPRPILDGFKSKFEGESTW